MAQMQEYLKEYIRLMGDKDLQAVQPAKTNQISAEVAAPANKALTTNSTASRFQTQPSTTPINPVVAKPVVKPYRPQPSVLNESDYFDGRNQINQGPHPSLFGPANNEAKSSRRNGPNESSIGSLNKNFSPKLNYGRGRIIK